VVRRLEIKGVGFGRGAPRARAHAWGVLDGGFGVCISVPIARLIPQPQASLLLCLSLENLASSRPLALGWSMSTESGCLVLGCFSVLLDRPYFSATMIRLIRSRPYSSVVVLNHGCYC
jgi:hypothetical protein